MSTSTGVPDAPPRAADVALRDGSAVHVRPVKADDALAIRAFFDALSVESLGLRFFGIPNLKWATTWALDVDYASRYALVATAGPSHTIVAHGAYIRAEGRRAEVAFVVADAWQGRGIATIMLGQLAAAAQEHGIAVFCADVLPHNHRMVDVFRDSGFPVELHTKSGVISVEFPTSNSAEAQRRFEVREHTAAVAAVCSFLHPHSVAVIGASSRRGTVGGETFHNLRAAGYRGPLYPVNLHAHPVEAQRSYRSIGEVPGQVELAIVAVPAVDATAVAAACGAAGVRALVVLSAGFADSGAEGARRQRELLCVCRESGMRLVGPNCLGVLNTAADVRLNATFAETMLSPGRVGLLAQSGGLGIAMIEAASRLGLGLSSFVSVGNKADISGNDLLQFWEGDQNTDMVLLYLESFGNPRQFARIARRVSRTKPIVAVKSGRSAAAEPLATSRIARILAASDLTVDALFEQTGVIRADTIHQLFDIAALLSAQPAPAGRRVAIVSNADGPSSLCADACRAGGLDLVELPASVARCLAGLMPEGSSLTNPIDIGPRATASNYRDAIKTLVHAHACDAILTVHVSSPLARGDDVARQIHAAAQLADGVTLAAVSMGSGVPAGEAALGEMGVPQFDFPEDAARAVAHAGRYGSWRARPPGTVHEPSGCRPDEAAAIVAEGLGSGSQWLAAADVAALLDCFGLPLPAKRASEPGAAEVTLGVVHDVSFGPVIVCAAAGARAGSTRDVVARITPLTDVDAGEMVLALANFLPLPESPARALASLHDVLTRVSALVEALPQVAELELTALVASRQEVVVGKARVRVEAAPPNPPQSSLRG